jgi:transposase
MYRVTLDPARREELHRRTREASITPRTRDRLEMIRLSAAGLSVPRIARQMDCSEQTVRKYIKAYLEEGFAALPDRPHPGPPAKVKEKHLQALEQKLDETDRAFTAPQLADWLKSEHGVTVHPDHLRVLLHRRGFRWKRMKRSVEHKQSDPVAQEAAEIELEALKNGGV